MSGEAAKGAYRMGVPGWVFVALISLLTGAVIELNRNTPVGWILFAAAVIGMIVIGIKFAASWSRGGRALCILGFLAICVGIVFLTWPPYRQVAASDARDPRRTEVYTTSGGDVRGVALSSGVEIFAGIPYAAPPVGELRWKKPQDPEPWSGIRECDTFAPMSMQVQSVPIYTSLSHIVGFHDYQISADDSFVEARSEDSLYLNIWKPAGKVEKAPVAVYIHGGSLKTGTPSFADYSGEGFARDGIIVVNMGYRLGVFGFLATEEMMESEGTAGNFGLLDQIKALEWVQKNIAAFGGDPENVTIIGESAGAVCVDALCVSPLAAGLFNRAILESSAISSPKPPHSWRLFEDALAAGETLMKKYGCSSLEELRKIPAEKLVGEQETQHHVTVDGYVLPDTPYRMRRQGIHNEEAVLHGYNAEESGPFIIFAHANSGNYAQKLRLLTGDYAGEVEKLYPGKTNEEADRNWAKIYGAAFFNYSHYCLNRLEQAVGVPSWEYLFTKSNGRLGSWHSGELIYAFGNIPENSGLFTEEDRALSKAMHACWGAFIRNGDPNCEELSGFEQSAASDAVMEFGSHTGMIREPDLALYEIFDRMQGWE